MSYFPGDSQIFGPLFGDDRVDELFSDARYLQTIIEVEVALAKVQGQAGLIPSEAADRIGRRGGSLEADTSRLAAATARDGFPIVELVRQLRAHVGGDAASFVHWGATTQDVIDTALMLRLRKGLAVIAGSLDQVIEQLADLARKHGDTLMVARTHAQQALPTTFGYKVARWLAPLLRHRDRLGELRPRLLVVQLGGAAGTLASFGEKGPEVQQALAAELGLATPLGPWHAQRDALAELAGWLSMVTGGLGKFALDVILMSQTEVGEVHESADGGGGGSSAMPQKRNPIRSEAILAAARQNAVLLGGVHQALVQEHERGTHGWQLEWMTLPPMVGLTSGALKNAACLSAGIQVDEDRMRRNVHRSNGLLMAEAASLWLSEIMPRAEAYATVKKAVASSRETGRHLIDVLEEHVASELDWMALRDESSYLGAAKTFTNDIVRAARRG